MGPYPDLAVALLAGGHSRRMGRDKAALPHPAGGTLLSRQLALLDALAPAQRLLSLRAAQPAPAGLPPAWHVVRDDGTSGPLGGLVAALRACLAPPLLVLAVDLPFIDLATLNQLLTAASPAGLVPTTPHGCEPLAALYPRTFLAVAEAALAAGDLRLQNLVAPLPAWPAPDPSRFTNWNTPADLPPA